jgi:hypothetical protein
MQTHSTGTLNRWELSISFIHPVPLTVDEGSAVSGTHAVSSPNDPAKGHDSGVRQMSIRMLKSI